MLTNFLVILKDLVEKNCVLQSFYPGYVADLNANKITKWPCLSVWYDTLVGRKEKQANGLFRTFEMTVEFLTLQGYFNDNSLDKTYSDELYKVKRWDELQQVADAFIHDIENISKKLIRDQSEHVFLIEDVSAGTRFSRSAWLNSQSGSQYKANQANTRLISVMQTFTIAFPLHLCDNLCCCKEDYCLPPLEIIDPKKLVQGGELKC